MRFVQALLVSLSLVIGIGLATPALAQGVADAKASGLVGEQPNGYLGSISSNPSADVSALISDTNNKRRNVYISRAKKAGVSRQVMEQRIGQRLIQKAPTGQYFKSAGGRWQKK
ncbi:MAG: YdbL family protein [Motiliproteus sp.]